MEKKYRLISIISFPKVYVDPQQMADPTGTVAKWAVYFNTTEVCVREWVKDKEYFEEVKPARIKMNFHSRVYYDNPERSAGYGYAFHNNNEFQIRITDEQRQRVEAAVNGEVFTREDVEAFAIYCYNREGSPVFVDVVHRWFNDWIKSRNNANKE